MVTHDGGRVAGGGDGKGRGSGSEVEEGKAQWRRSDS
jgi:hypothetical protein